MSRALQRPDLHAALSVPVHVIAAGKAAGDMAAAFAASDRAPAQSLLAVGTHRPAHLADAVEYHDGGHPFPDERSVAAGMRASDIAAAVPSGHTLLLLLSGGASSLLAQPAPGISLEDKRRTVERMMHEGADIDPLNVVRKHLSAIKGGQLAAACRGATITLAVSDVVSGDLSVIGSGPGVADSTTWADAAAALARFGGTRHPEAVRDRIAGGLDGRFADTPKPGDPRLRRASGFVIASRHDALAGAGQTAARLGYRVIVLADPVLGEARHAATEWFAAVQRQVSALREPVCVLSAGETTVRVTGSGRGGRNLEFALALAEPVQEAGRDIVAASLGTDGIDGSSDAAGAMVDRTTLARAREVGAAEPARYLAENDSAAFFEPLGDLIRTGRTDTNVGDLQVYLQAPASAND